MLSRPALSSRRYWVVAWALVAVAVVLHTVVLAQGSFYTDDLVLIGHYQHCGLSSTCLFWNHHGHLMPGAFLLSGLATRLAPLQWWLPALQLGLLHLLAVLATLRMVTVMGGKRWLSLAALGVVLVVGGPHVCSAVGGVGVDGGGYRAAVPVNGCRSPSAADGAHYPGVSVHPLLL